MGEEPSLSGRVALVTGGGRGLGRVIALALARAGASVVITGRSEEHLASTERLISSEGGTVRSFVADVTDEEAMARAMKEARSRFAPVDLLVNNAGMNGPVGPLWEVDPAEWWRTFDVHLGGVFRCVRLVLPDMIAAGRGCIVNITSTAGVERWPQVSAYAISKAAVIKLTENLAVELKGTGVSVFSVHPGLLRIGLTEGALDGERPAPGSHEERVFNWIQGQLEQGKDVPADRAVDLVIALASGRADALSGRHLSVSDDLDVLLLRAEEIRRGDLLMLRLRTAAEEP